MDGLLLLVSALGVVCVFRLAIIHGRTLLVALGVGLGVFGISFGIGALAGASRLAASVMGVLVAELAYLIVSFPVERVERRRERAEAELELETSIETEKHRERSIEEMRRYWSQD